MQPLGRVWSVVHSRILTNIRGSIAASWDTRQALALRTACTDVHTVLRQIGESAEKNVNILTDNFIIDLNKKHSPKITF